MNKKKNIIISFGILVVSAIMVIKLYESNVVFASYFTILAFIALSRISYIVILPDDYVYKVDKYEIAELLTRIVFLVCVYLTPDGSWLGIGLKIAVWIIGVKYGLRFLRQNVDKGKPYRLKDT